LARNRYGWQKRAKELARKQKQDEKMNRRRGKTRTEPAAWPAATGAEMTGSGETDAAGEPSPPGTAPAD